MIFTIFAILIAVEIIISYKCLTVTDYKIKSDKIKETTKIVLISDLHNSQFGSKNKRLVDKIQKQDPDLILMDGGKGQVNVALQVLEDLNLNIPVCGMVKDDKHRTRGLYFRNQEIPIKRDSEGFKLTTRIQDEAHRFAIEYHRSLRSKGQVHSILDDIEGIGPARRKALMRNFMSLDAIKAASVEELAQIPSMNEKAAESVYKFFHK